MADVIVREVVRGVDGSDVRCGVIGEIGCSWPLVDTERKALQAAAIAQKETGEMAGRNNVDVVMQMLILSS